MKKIRVVSPAKSINKTIVEAAQKWLEQKGFQVSVSPNAIGEHNYFSGSDEARLADLQAAMDDEELDVILCARGGYGSVRLVDKLNYSGCIKKPKLILGYSDITVFHNRMNIMGFPSGHTTAPLNFNENTPEALESLYRLIMGKGNRYEIPAHEQNRTGEVTAEVVGGNLSIIASLIGTNDDLDVQGKILFVEEVGEAIYSIDRMFHSLKKSGKLESLKGLIVGGMSAIKDSAVPFGKKVEEVISELVSEYDFPLCFNFPAGHIDDNRAILLGTEAKLQVGTDQTIFTQTQG
ncbi:MAG: LD-carboxypeptidase [Crocinitomicaceae bacterium]